MKKITVIIPVYNCEEYLSVCLDSVVNQTIGIKNLEIIVINDGSTDNSLKILKEYAQKYKEIVLIDGKNKGVSYVRNLGIEKATSEYITFLDSDDYLRLDALLLMYKKIAETNSDLVIARINGFDETKEYGYYSDKYIIKKDNYTYKDYKKVINTISICSKLYKKEIIKDIKFMLNIRHEDNYFSLKLLTSNIVISNIEEHLYYRRYRNSENVSMMQNLKLETFQFLLLNYVKVLSEYSDDYLIKFMIKKSNNYIFKNLKKEDRKEAINKLNEFINKNIQNNVKFYQIYDKMYRNVLKVIVR